MKSFFSSKRRVLGLVGLTLLLVVPFLSNSKKKIRDSASLNLPPLPKDEADQYVERASQNYFFHEYSQATENYRKAITVYEIRNDLKNVAMTYQSIGDVYKVTRNHEQAEQEYLTAADYHGRIKNFEGQAKAFTKIGNLHMDLKHSDKALKWYQKALTQVEKRPPSMTLGQTQETIGRYFWKANDKETAANHISAAQKTFSQIGFQMGYEHMGHILDILNGKKSELHPHAIRSRRPEQYNP